MSGIRVLIVDDHPMVRRGLRSLLSSYADIEVAGEAADGVAALQEAGALQPDVILLDIRLPGAEGVDIASQLRREVPDAKIIVLTAFDNEEYVMGALRAGAVAYLLKSASDEMLVDTIRAVHEGKRVLSPSLMDTVLEQFESLAKAQAQAASGLSVEELLVVRLIAQGATNEDIVKETFWSERTVKRRIEEIINKLGARNRAQAVARAIKRGLI